MNTPVVGPTQGTTLGIDEIVQAIKARAGYDVLYPVGRTKDGVIEFVSRLRGDYPEAYDIIGAGAWVEHNRILKAKAMATFENRSDGLPDAFPFDWSKATKVEVVRAVMDLTVSMKGGKGRREGVEISKTTPMVEQRRRWSWGRE